MATELQPDPYRALGVDQDADAETIKKAHRKLILKHHPDRIKDPSQIEVNKNAFQKVQEAYETLIDPEKREKYDQEIKLARLRAGVEALRSFTTRPTGTPSRETRAAFVFEDRVPEPDYFNIPHREPRYDYEDPPLSRAGAGRKADQDRRGSRDMPKSRREEERTSSYAREDSRPYEMPPNLKDNLKRFAQKARDDVSRREKEREEFRRGEDRKARDKAERRDRLEKENNTRTPQRASYQSDASDDDSDTVVSSRGQRRPPMRAAQTQYASRRSFSPEPMYERRRSSPVRPTSSRGREAVEYEQKFDVAAEMISRNLKRPVLDRTGSQHTYVYRSRKIPEVESDEELDRRSPTSPKPNRRSATESHVRPPMATQASAPSTLRSQVNDLNRDGVPTKSGSENYRSGLRDPPGFYRSPSEPIQSHNGRRDATQRTSNLAHEWQPDSGYVSKSSPDLDGNDRYSPERRDSGRRESERRDSERRESDRNLGRRDSDRDRDRDRDREREHRDSDSRDPARRPGMPSTTSFSYRVNKNGEVNGASRTRKPSPVRRNSPPMPVREDAEESVSGRHLRPEEAETRRQYTDPRTKDFDRARDSERGQERRASPGTSTNRKKRPDSPLETGSSVGRSKDESSSRKKEEKASKKTGQWERPAQPSRRDTSQRAAVNPATFKMSDVKTAMKESVHRPLNTAKYSLDSSHDERAAPSSYRSRPTMTRQRSGSVAS